MSVCTQKPTGESVNTKHCETYIHQGVLNGVRAKTAARPELSITRVSQTFHYAIYKTAAELVKAPTLNSRYQRMHQY